MTTTKAEYYKKLELYKKLQTQKRLQKELPHLYAFKLHKWQREFLENNNLLKMLVAANQSGKSTILHLLMARCLFDQEHWHKYWPKHLPRTLWYIYPSLDKATEEFTQKIERDILPRGSMMNHPQYGWSPTFNAKGQIKAIRSNSGVTVFFKSWLQDHQAATLDGVFVDEEMPYSLYPELAQRVRARKGFIAMGFTATRGEVEWYRSIERIGKKDELFPDAYKRQISMYDCLTYEDGSPSHITQSDIDRAIAMCGDETEVQKRIFGRFVLSKSGRKYSAFDKRIHLVKAEPITPGWFIYAGIDCGSGGKAHKAAITLVAVRPDFRFARIVRSWRGDDRTKTTAEDILNKYLEITRGLTVTAAYYDYSAADLGIIAMRSGIPLQKADKSQEIGVNLINTYFKNGMLVIDDLPECETLVEELVNLKEGVKKTHAVDDQIDSMRYAISKIPMNVDHINQNTVIVKTEEKKKLTRHDLLLTRHDVDEDAHDLDFEIDDFNALLEAY